MKVLAYPAYKNTHVNPYTRLLYENMPKNVQVKDINFWDLLLGRCDLIHLHWTAENITRDSNWFKSLFKSYTLLSLLSLNKLRGKRILESIHDGKAHCVTHPKLFNWVYSKLHRLIDQYVPVQMYHGHYANHYPNVEHPLISKDSLGVSKPCILFLGMIEPYKGIGQLVEAYRSLSERYHIIVAGKVCNQMKPVIRELAAMPNTTIYPEFVPDNRLQTFFNAADLVVLPFTEILNSGSVVLSLSFNRPVLVPAIGNMNYLQGLFPEWVNTYTGELESTHIEETFKKLPVGDIDLSPISWKKQSRQIYENYYI